MREKKPQFAVIGLALFSMFFGSGNLIFPLTLGRDAGSDFLISACGFILSAVLIPCLGVLAITFAQGHYERIFASVFRGHLNTAIIFLVLLSFIPFGAGPRCVVLAHASLKTFLPIPNLWIFSLFFLGLVALMIHDRGHLLDLLGKILTPLLLLCIFVMVVFAFLNGEIDPPLMAKRELFLNSLFEGYNTQDLMSSLFFSSSLIYLIRSSFSNQKEMIRTTLKGAFFGIILLAILYVSLIAAASFHSDILVNKNGIDLVSILALHTLGDKFGLVAGIAVSLACLTTAVALIMSFSEFLQRKFLTKKFQNLALPISILSVYTTALLEFDGIMAIIAPMMKILYPVIMIAVIKFLFDHFKKSKSL